MRNTKTRNLFGEEISANTRYLDEDNPWDHWHGMPNYDPCSKYEECKAAIEIEFEDEAALEKFKKIINRPEITTKTKATCYPKDVRLDTRQTYICSFERTGKYDPANFPKYPIYIPSKSRWEKRPTSDWLVLCGIPHYIVVEEHQVEKYKAVVDPKFVTILTLDQKYLDEYDTFDDLGATKSKGPGAARNFAWDHSISLGAERHWVIDDNENPFYRLDGPDRLKAKTGAIFRAMEDHSDRYENVYISGPAYKFFAVPRTTLPPFVQNTRIYSTLLIKNDIPYRWRGRYNEDTDLSLRVLKDGHCTIQYNAFLVNKLVTQALAGGNTEAFYSKEGTMPKSKMLEDMHPDVAKMVWKFNRWHHYVDYAPYRKNRLKYKESYYVNPDPEYGMKLAYVDWGKQNSGDEDDE